MGPARTLTLLLLLGSCLLLVAPDQSSNAELDAEGRDGEDAQEQGDERDEQAGGW